MTKSTPESDRADINALIDLLLDAGRRGGSARVHELIDYGGFDLSSFLRNVNAGWLLLLHHPAVWLRHKRWIASCQTTSVNSAAAWEALKAAEQNIAVAEFGQHRFDFDERIRLRNIRQGHNISFWRFRYLLISLAVKCNDGQIVLRAPSRFASLILNALRRFWALICFLLLARATLTYTSTWCLSCDVLVPFLLLPVMLFVWWITYTSSNGWRIAWNKLNDMAIARI
jgi:hypothetical protein